MVRSWLTAQSEAFRQGIEIVSMDGFIGYAHAIKEILPHADIVLGPFHVTKLAVDKIDLFRRQQQRKIHGRRGRKGDAIYGGRRLLLTSKAHMTPKRKGQIKVLVNKMEAKDTFMTLINCANWVQATYRAADDAEGHAIMERFIGWLEHAPKAQIPQLRSLRMTFTRRADAILAHFHTRITNAAAEAINGRLEQLRRTALGFRNIANYRYRVFIHSGPCTPPHTR